MWVKKLPGPGEFPLLVTRIIWQGAGLRHAVIFGEKKSEYFENQVRGLSEGEASPGEFPWTCLILNQVCRSSLYPQYRVILILTFICKHTSGIYVGVITHLLPEQ